MHASSPEPLGDFDTFFRTATGNRPYDYQRRLAQGVCESRLINVPTGLGKTAAVTLAWLWNQTNGSKWPRRLVYCLPMRTLVEQTEENVSGWLQNLAQAFPNEELKWLAGNSPVILMGGDEEKKQSDWDIHPERPAILIGTQDMLLSRALNRGYGMSRYRWPMQFGLLNNDCLWVMDETQLMGPGLWTSGQLDWMRNHRFGVTKPCTTWWMSATNSPVFLDTPDRRKQQLAVPGSVEVGEDQKVQPRLNPTRPLSFWKGGTAKPKSKKRGAPTAECSDILALAICNEHTAGTLSLVVCNSVQVAQGLYLRISALMGRGDVILLTSRFRPYDRDAQVKRLLAFEKQRKQAAKDSKNDTLSDSPGLICVSTQVIEAGVDISARKLWMEAAPWSSMLQRLGRSNRDGLADGKAKAFVFAPEKKGKGQPVGPYETKDIEASVKLLTKLAAIYENDPNLGGATAMAKLRAIAGSEMDAALKPKDEPFPRANDVYGLFSTEPDLFGGFTDVSGWIRGQDKNADIIVFWRAFDPQKRPGKGAALSGPVFDAMEGCPVALHRFREFLGEKGRALVWDERLEEWKSMWPSDICPGMVVMLPLSAGGYLYSEKTGEQLGWTGRADDKLKTAEPPGRFSDTFDDDANSEQAGWVSVDSHLADTKAVAIQIADELRLDAAARTAIVSAAELHDIGKSHPVWQSALPILEPNAKQLWAKAPFVFAFKGKNSAAFRESTQRLMAAAGIASKFFREELNDGVPKQLWITSGKVCDTRSRKLLSEITKQAAGLSGGMRRFLPRPSPDKPCIRHEAASALAAWCRYFKESACWPGLTIFLIACHHGKVRTVVYARGGGGEDVWGVPKEPELLPWRGGMSMDFSCAAVGTSGEFSSDGLTFTPDTPGWTALVADLLGGWEQRPEQLPPPLALRQSSEPRLLGPFSLAYFESLICAADIRASKNPSNLRYV